MLNTSVKKSWKIKGDQTRDIVFCKEELIKGMWVTKKENFIRFIAVGTCVTLHKTNKKYIWKMTLSHKSYKIVFNQINLQNSEVQLILLRLQCILSWLCYFITTLR